MGITTYWEERGQEAAGKEGAKVQPRVRGKTQPKGVTEVKKGRAGPDYRPIGGWILKSVWGSVLKK